MDAYIKKIYDMLYSPIISPYNLLENAKLDNYSYVKYYKNKIGLVAEMQCVIPGEGERVFFYQFDKKDYLQVIYEGTIEKRNIIFSREEAVLSAKEEYFQINQYLRMFVNLKSISANNLKCSFLYWKKIQFETRFFLKLIWECCQNRNMRIGVMGKFHI